MRRILHLLLLATVILSAQLLISSCAHDMDDGSSGQSELPLSTRGVSQTLAE